MLNNKKNVGILTYSNTTNYGAILQALALKKVITNFGYNCDVLNYRCEAVTKRENVWFDGSKNSLKTILKKAMMLPIKLYRKAKIASFVRNIKLYSNKVYSRSNISTANEQYDTFVVGSDQVWNLNLNGHDDSYVLDFVENQKCKIAYAASVGNNYTISSNVEYFKKHLSDFNYISLREGSTGRLLQDNGVKCVSVVDPTFLLDKNKWLDLIPTSLHKKKKYILLYFIHNGNSSFNIAKNIASKLGYEIIYLNNYGIPVKGMKNIYSITPYEFIEYINNAELIITGSFHGIAFSINLNKPFFYEKSNASQNMNERVYNLVEMFSLTNSISDVNIENMKLEEILDYGKINEILEQEREKATKLMKEWLKA